MPEVATEGANRAPSAAPRLHVFEGMTSATPLLRPTFASVGVPTFGFGTTVGGSLVGGALGADEVVVVCIEGLAVAVYGCDTLGVGDAAYTIGAEWFDGSAVSTRLHAFHVEVDVDRLPTAYLGYETIPLDLADGVGALADLDFDPVPADALSGTTSVPVALPDADLLVSARFGPNLSMPLFDIENPGAAFDMLVPVLPGLSYDVVFAASNADATVITWKRDVGLDAGAIAVAVPAEMVAPADGAIGVDLTTSFGTTAVGGARTYIWDSVGAGPDLALTTTRTSATVADPALGGFAFPAGAAYNWTVLGHGDEGVDSAASGGYADYLTLFYGVLGGGGPGHDGDRTLALPTTDRGFTFAP